MPRRRNPVPAYKLHKPSGQARVRVNGRDRYLGRYGTPESLAEYERVCAELRTAAGAPGPLPRDHGLTVNELLVAFLDHAEHHYRRPDGTCTNEVSEYRLAMRPLRALYGHTPAREFGPVALQAVRGRMVELGWCRTRVNKQVGRVKRVFRWAVAQEVVPAAVSQALGCVAGLRAGRTAARETEPVGPVAVEAVTATLPHLWPTVRAMVELQLHTGMRPGEVRTLRPGEVDRSGDVWVYRPRAHKTAYRGRERVILLGPRARAVLARWIEGADPAAVLFTPARAREERFALRRQARKSRVQPSQRDRRKPPAELKKRVPPAFTDHGYAAVVRRACRRAGVDPWHPNQLRHTFATAVRGKFGLEAAQVLLGHARADVTQVYAERDYALAARVVADVG